MPEAAVSIDLFWPSVCEAARCGDIELVRDHVTIDPTCVHKRGQGVGFRCDSRCSLRICKCWRYSGSFSRFPLFSDISPLHSSARYGQLDVCRLLLASKAEITNDKWCDTRRNMRICKCGRDSAFVCNGFMTFFCVGVKLPCTCLLVTVTPIFVDCSSRPKLKSMRETISTTPAIACASSANAGVIPLSVSTISRRSLRRRETPLHLSSCHGRFDVCRLLLHSKAHVNECDRRCDTRRKMHICKCGRDSAVVLSPSVLGEALLCTCVRSTVTPKFVGCSSRPKLKLM